MKKPLLLLLFVCCSLFSIAQDILIKKSGEDIKAKVIEIGITEIKYKRFDFQDGPTYSILKSDILVIRYENGINEVISTNQVEQKIQDIKIEPAVAPVTVVKEPEVFSEKIDYLLGSYSQNGRYISKTRVLIALKKTNDAQIMTLLKKSKGLKTKGNIIAAGLGIPLMVIGSLTALSGISKAQIGVDPDAVGIITVGGVMAGTGIVFQFANIGFNAKSKRYLTKAISIYNTNYADKPKLN